MAMYLIHTIGSFIAAFAEDYMNTFCLGVSRNMRSVSVPVRKRTALISKRHHNMGKPRKRLDGESAK